MDACPVCNQSFRSKRSRNEHFRQSMQGFGESPVAHVKWAGDRGISQMAGIMSDLEALDKLYALLDSANPS